jgi:hypothetical protein
MYKQQLPCPAPVHILQHHIYNPKPLIIVAAQLFPRTCGNCNKAISTTFFEFQRDCSHRSLGVHRQSYPRIERVKERTRVCRGDRGSRPITQAVSDCRSCEHQNGAHAANDDGVEDGGFLNGSPVQVLEGLRKEARCRHRVCVMLN